MAGSAETGTGNLFSSLTRESDGLVETMVLAIFLGLSGVIGRALSRDLRAILLLFGLKIAVANRERWVID